MSPALKIKVFGKKNCGLCDAAKDKLRLMEYSFDFIDIGPLVSHHEGWRTDGSVEATAINAMFDGHVPVLQVGSALLTYPQAMRLLKEKEAARETKDVARVKQVASPVFGQVLVPAIAV